MMKYKPAKQTAATATQSKELSQRETDRILFYDHYNKWKKETSIFSNFYLTKSNEHYKAMMKMGRRAVPFLYEMLKNNEGRYTFWMLEEIYGCQFGRGTNSISEAQKIAEETKDSWLQKIEEEGDI